MSRGLNVCRSNTPSMGIWMGSSISCSRYIQSAVCQRFQGCLANQTRLWSPIEIVPLIVIRCLDCPLGIRNVWAFHRLPQNAVEQVLGTLVCLFERQSGGSVSILAQQTVRDIFR